MLESPEVYSLALESPQHVQVLWDVRKEVTALLSPVCSHPNIVRLIGVVSDTYERPVRLLFEFAQHGDLER